MSDEVQSVAAPVRPVRSKAVQSNSATMLALFGLLLIGSALLGLLAMVLPQALGLVLVVGGLFVVPLALHYLVWGWWLSQLKGDDAAGDSPPTTNRPRG